MVWELGPVHVASGMIYEAVNLGWKNYPLKDLLEVETGLPVVIDNDANLAALGEMWKGAGEGAKDLICDTWHWCWRRCNCQW